MIVADKPSLSETTKVIAAIATLVAALANVYVIIQVQEDVTEVKKDVQVVHLSINSRMDDLLEKTELVAIEIGKKEGRQALKEENALRTEGREEGRER